MKKSVVAALAATAMLSPLALAGPAAASGKVHPPRQWLGVVKCTHMKPGQTPPIHCPVQKTKRVPIPMPGPGGNIR